MQGLPYRATEEDIVSNAYMYQCNYDIEYENRKYIEIGTLY